MCCRLLRERTAGGGCIVILAIKLLQDPGNRYIPEAPSVLETNE